MTVAPVSDRFVSITAVAGQTVLAYDFQLTIATGLAVLRIREGTPFRLTLGDDYSFPAGLGGVGGGTATLAQPALDGDIYQLIGLLPERRGSDFLETQAFLSAKFNGDLDYLTFVAQEHRRDIDRSLQMPFGADPLPKDHFPLADGNGGMKDGGTAADIAAAQEKASIAVAAADRSEAARDASLLAMASLVPNVFPTKSAVELYAPTIAPPALRSAFLDTDYVAGSGSEYIDAGTADPGQPGQAQVVAGGVTHFYTRSNKVLRPQQHGCKTGGDPAVNRAALIEMFNEADWHGGREIDMGDANDVYDIDDQYTHYWQSSPIIRGSGATIRLNRGAGAPTMFGLRFIVDDLGCDLEGFEVDGNFSTPNPFWIENSVVPYVEANIHDARLVGIFGSNGYRQTTDDFAGRGLNVLGWFRHLLVKQSGCREMKMAAGSSIVNVTAGIVNVYIGRSVNDTYPIFKDIDDLIIGRTWSEDPAYANDMDGLMIFDPLPTGFTTRVKGATNMRGGEFTDNWHRAMKIQAQNVDITGPVFRLLNDPNPSRTSRPTCCVDFQFGEGSIRGGRLFCEGNIAPNYGVIGTARTYGAGLLDVDNFTVVGKGTVPPTMEAIAWRYAETGHLFGSLSVRNCAANFVEPKYIAKMRSLAATEMARVTDNTVRNLGTAGLYLEGSGSNAIKAKFQGNANLSGTLRPMTQVSGATMTLIGATADNSYFS